MIKTSGNHFFLLSDLALLECPQLQLDSEWSAVGSHLIKTSITHVQHVQISTLAAMQCRRSPSLGLAPRLGFTISLYFTSVSVDSSAALQLDSISRRTRSQAHLQVVKQLF